MFACKSYVGSEGRLFHSGKIAIPVIKLLMVEQALELTTNL